MSVKGKTREQGFSKELFVGLATVKVVAINPTRSELRSIMGGKEGEEKEEFNYLDKDPEGNARLKLSFILQELDSGKYFFHNIYLVNKMRISKDGLKGQIINSTCDATFVPLKLDKNGDPIMEINEELIPDWFLQFINRKTNEVLGEKMWRNSLVGEEELCTLTRMWLGKLRWNDKDTEVFFDMDKLLNEDYRELRAQIGGVYSTPFIILTGVSTNKDTGNKKQEIYKKKYLPASMMNGIKNGLKFDDYERKTWKTFVDDAEGEYGFSHYHKLIPMVKYTEDEDPVTTNQGKLNTATTSNEY